TISIRMESFLNDLIRHVRTIEIAGVDVVHAGSYRFTQHGDGGIGIARWPKHAGTGELHGAVTHAVNGHRSAGKCEFAAELLVFVVHSDEISPYPAMKPPSTTSDVPVVNFASSEQRYRPAAAISSLEPMRPTG